MNIFNKNKTMGNNTLLQELMTHVSDGVAIYEPIDDGKDFVFKDINPAGEKSGKAKKDDVVGKKVTEVFPGVKEMGLFEVFQRVWKTGKPETLPVKQYADERISQIVENYVFKTPEGEIVAIYRDITEQKKTQKEYERIFNNFPDLYYQTDLEGNTKLVSPSAEQLSGYTAEELIGRNATDVYANPTDRDKFLAELQKTGKVEGYELDLIKKSGDIVRVSVSSHFILDDKGTPVGVEGVMHDITKRKKAQQRFKDIAQSIGDWIWEVDKDGKYTFVSGKTKALLGYEPDEILGKTPFDLMTPEEAKRVGKVFHDLSAEKKPVVDFENWHLRKNGSKVLLSTNGVPILDSKGNLTGYRGVNKDITKTKESETKLQQIIDHSQEVFYIHDTNHVLTYVSPYSTELFGYTPEEMMIKWTELTTDNPINEEGFKLTEKAIETGETQAPYPLELKCKDGRTIFVEINESPVKDGSGKVIAISGSVRNITDQRKAEADLEQKMKDMERLNKLMVGREIKMAEMKEKMKGINSNDNNHA